MTTDFTRVPLHDHTTFHRVPEHLFDAAVRNVIAELGPMEDEQAMKIVDAVFGPLRLLSPPPGPSQTPFLGFCEHMYYSREGGWLFCALEHEDEDPDDPHTWHEAKDKTAWRAYDGEERAFGTTAQRRNSMEA